MENPHRALKYNIEIKILELIEAFLIYKKKSILFLMFCDPIHNVSVRDRTFSSQTPTFTLCKAKKNVQKNLATYKNERNGRVD